MVFTEPLHDANSNNASKNTLSHHNISIKKKNVYSSSFSPVGEKKDVRRCLMSSKKP